MSSQRLESRTIFAMRVPESYNEEMRSGPALLSF
jgi:hypothetical protein